MRTLTLIFVGLFAVNAFANYDIGTEIKPLTQNGKLRVGVQYSSEFLSATISITANDLDKGTGARVIAEFWNKESAQPYSDLIWQNSINPGAPAGATYVILAGVKGAAAKGPVAKLKSLALVLTAFQTTGAERKVFIDLGALCTSNPNNFLNLDNMTTGCP